MDLPPSDRPDKDTGATGHQALGVLAVGTVMASSVVVCTLLGYWLDDRWGTEPWLLLTGVLLGTAAGFVHMAKIIRRFGK